MSPSKILFNGMRKSFPFIVSISMMVIGGRAFSQPLAAGHDKFLGSADDGAVEPSFDTYWNQFTPGNSGKWAYTEPSRDVYGWGGLDAAYNYAKQRGFLFKMHTLIWGQQQPGWISGLSDQEKAEEIEEWIKLVGERYPDLDFVDVVNEPIASHNPPDGNNGRANYKDALGGNGTTGWDWVIWSFQKARQYIPRAKLILNDYGIINDNGATNTYLQIVNLLKDRGLIDGIGVQGHRFEFENADTTVLKNNATKLGATGLPVYISEFDLGNIGNTGTPNDAVQLQLYKKIFPVLWNHPAIKGITLWGYTQGDVWQQTAYIVRADGTERPAMVWLRSFLSKGNYRSAKSGNWNDISTWERHNDTGWVAASGVPVLSDRVVIISAGDTVTVTANDSLAELTVAAGGTMAIDTGVTFKVKNEEGTDLTVNGTVINSGSITTEDSAEVKFASGGKYLHALEGGAIPLSTWGAGSTIQFDSVKTTAPSNGNQNFHHVVWNNTLQSSNLNLGWNGNTIGGNITVISTGNARWQMCAPAAGNSATVNINGDIIQTGGQFTTNGTGNGNTAITINHSGNVNVTGGNFSISRGSQGGTGTAIWNFTGTSFALSNAATQNSNPAGAKFVFAGSGIQTLTLGSGNTLTALPLEVKSGSTLRTGTSMIKGSGIFALDSGATLETAHQAGIDSTINITGLLSSSEFAIYSFNGTEAQVTGFTMPDTVGGVTVNNAVSLTLSDSIVVNGTFDLKKGLFSLNGNALSYGPKGTLKYSATSAQTTTDVEFPTIGGPKHLNISNVVGVTLSSSKNILGNVHLAGKLTLGTNTLTASTASNIGPTRFIVTGAGRFILTASGNAEKFFPVGTTLYAPLWVTNSGDDDTIGVSVVADATPAPEGGRLAAKWDLSENTEGGGNYLLRFGWVTQLENSAFRTPNREHNAHIFWLGDTTVAGSGNYATQFATQPYTVSRAGITTLGAFAVGRFKDVPDITGVASIAEAPAEFALEQNYPNPFNPTTTIRFSLPEKSDVRISLVNTVGQIIAEIANGNYAAGHHQVTLNASSLASGIYFYRLETSAGFARTKKLVLLK